MSKKARIIELEAEVAKLEAEVVRLNDKLEVKQKFDELGSLIADGGWITDTNITSSIRNSGGAILLDDFFGGKVFEHEAVPVTVLDEKGKASYSQTKNKPDKGFEYVLVRPNQQTK